MPSQKRVVAHMIGGLGNQLFIYAAAYALARRNGAELYLDTSGFARDWQYKRKFALHNFVVGSSLRLRDFPAADLLGRVYGKMRNRISFLPACAGRLLLEDLETGYDNSWLDDTLRRHGVWHVFGYRQNEHYFEAYRVELQAQLALLFEPSSELQMQALAIRSSQSVCVNLRRMHETLPGTNIPDPRVRVLGADYYRRAVGVIREQVENPIFYCFGDTLEGVDALLPPDVERVILPDTPDRPADIRDFYLMQQSRHFIIANSSFGWWAAWLGQGVGSIVICPDTEGFTYKVAPAAGWRVVPA